MLTAALASPACQEPTVVSVLIETDVPCDVVRGAGVAVTVGSSSQGIEGDRPNTVSYACEAGGLVGDLTLKRGGDDAVAFRIVLGAQPGVVTENACSPPAYEGCIVARRKLRYLPRQRLRIPVSLRQSCVNVPCDVEDTCVRGRCVPATIVDPSACAGDGCDESVLLPDEPPVAPPPDAGAPPDGSQGPTPQGHRLVAGDAHVCLLLNGVVHCMGDNKNGQLASDDDTLTGPIRVSLPDLARDLAAGFRHNCAVLVDGTVYCWGGAPGASPTKIDGIDGAVVLGAGNGYTCAVVEYVDTRRVKCWGDGELHVLGNGLQDPRDVPQWVKRALGVEFEGDIRAVFAGNGLTCALLGDVPYCWGTADWTGSASSPWATELTGHRATSVAIGYEHACFVYGDSSYGGSSTYCWGENTFAQVGMELDTPVSSPTALTDGPAFRSLSSRFNHTCGLDEDAKVYCWGDNASGQLRDPPGGTDRVPREVTTVSAASAVAVGSTFSCASSSSSGNSVTIQCWGGSIGGPFTITN